MTFVNPIKKSLCCGVAMAVVLAISSQAWAQVTVSGSTGADGTYASLTQAAGAIAAINANDQTGNNIVVDITADVLTEDGTNSLNAGAWTTLTIRPSGGAARTVSGTPAAGVPLINLNGASNVTIDGLNTGGDALTISNLSTSSTAGTSTIRFINGASDNTVTRCSILGSSTVAVGTAGGNVLFHTTTGGGNNNNTVSFNNIGPAGVDLPRKCISAVGTNTSAATQNTGNIIDSNNIFDFFSATASVSGIDIRTGNTNYTISNNRIYQTAPRTFTVPELRSTGAPQRRLKTTPSAAISSDLERPMGRARPQ